MRRIAFSAFTLMVLAPAVALAAQGPGTGPGTADARTQAFAAVLAFFPAITVTVFGVARWLGIVRG